MGRRSSRGRFRHFGNTRSRHTVLGALKPRDDAHPFLPNSRQPETEKYHYQGWLDERVKKRERKRGRRKKKEKARSSIRRKQNEWDKMAPTKLFKKRLYTARRVLSSAVEQSLASTFRLCFLALSFLLSRYTWPSRQHFFCPHYASVIREKKQSSLFVLFKRIQWNTSVASMNENKFSAVSRNFQFSKTTRLASPQSRRKVLCNNVKELQRHKKERLNKKKEKKGREAYHFPWPRTCDNMAAFLFYESVHMLRKKGTFCSWLSRCLP